MLGGQIHHLRLGLIGPRVPRDSIEKVGLAVADGAMNVKRVVAHLHAAGAFSDFARRGIGQPV